MENIKEIIEELFKVEEKKDAIFSTEKYKSAVDLTVDEMICLMLDKMGKNKVPLMSFKRTAATVGILKYEDGEFVLNMSNKHCSTFVMEVGIIYFSKVMEKEGKDSYIEMNEGLRLTGISKEEFGNMLWENNKGRLDKDGKIMFNKKAIKDGSVRAVKKSDLDDSGTIQKF